jgi:DNA-3-methyladenine glycosylase
MANSLEHPFPRAFYARDTVTVARALLGQRLVRVLDFRRLSGLICEVEAYGGPDDQASHAYRRTARSAIMYGPPGIAYVYFVYGMHHCLNAVAECDGQPGAVLIRSLVPLEGIALFRQNRPGASDRCLADGPGKLCQALGITRAQNGADLTSNTELFITAGESVTGQDITITPRIGVRGDAETGSRPWRFVWQPARPSAEPASHDPRTDSFLV